MVKLPYELIKFLNALELEDIFSNTNLLKAYIAKIFYLDKLKGLYI